MNIKNLNLAELWYSEAKAIGSEYNELMGDFYYEANEIMSQSFKQNSKECHKNPNEAK